MCGTLAMWVPPQEIDLTSPQEINLTSPQEIDLTVLTDIIMFNQTIGYGNNKLQVRYQMQIGGERLIHQVDFHDFLSLCCSELGTAVVLWCRTWTENRMRTCLSASFV